MIRKILSILIVLITVLSCSSFAFASSQEDAQLKYNRLMEEYGNELIIINLNMPKDATEEECRQAAAEYMEQYSAKGIDTTAITFPVFRYKPDAKECQVYLDWASTTPINAIAWTSINIGSYGTMGKLTWDVLLSSAGMEPLCTVKIPTSVTKVKITYKGLRAYAPEYDSWGISFNGSQTVTIK